VQKPPFAVTLALALFAGTNAHATRQPDHLAPSHVLETPEGPVRAFRQVSERAPRAFVGSAPLAASGSWRMLWDTATGVPLRIYGSGVAAPGSVDDPAAAEAAARRHLAANIALLAPGASVDDFALAANHEHNGVRVVGFRQRHRDLPVLGGHVSFRFKRDRLFVVASEALSHVSVSTTAIPDAASAERVATGWIDADYRTSSTAGHAGAAVIVPIVAGPGDIRFVAVRPIEVASVEPVGVWTVYVGAGDEPVARRQTLSFADGSVLYNTPVRYPGASRADFAAANTDLTVDGLLQTSDATGLVTFAAAATQVVTSVTGTFAAVSSLQGGLGSATLDLDDGGTAVWDESGDELLDAQLTALVHTTISNARARALNPALPFLDQQLPVTVNINSTCNANFDGNGVNFFASGPLPNSGGMINCENTARLVDVVHHEFGHAFHSGTLDQVGGNFDSAFSEGLSDYWAATIVDSPDMGPGFFQDDAPLRPMEGPDGDLVWPYGFSGKDTHVTGVIFASAMWDLRQALVAELGAGPGVALADELFYGAVQRAGSVFDSYIEILAEDDDDGNLANGTPNKCLIDKAFGAHGLGDLRDRLLGPGLDLPVRDGYDIVLPVVDVGGGCAPTEVTSVELTWQVRGDEPTPETLPMQLSGSEYRATIPTQPEGTVIQYQVAVTFADGNTRRMPLNRAEPFYELFNGSVEELYCHDFESDPSSDWTFGANDGLPSEFAWGTPQGGEQNFDPPAAFGGSFVIGTQLAGDGAYDSSRSTFAESPSIPTELTDVVHVQYRRWLGTEDSNFDQAVIYANDREVYRNPTVPFPFTLYPAADHEWRFHSVDVTGAAFDGSVQIKFELTSDDSGSAAGWNIDDFCIVKFVESVCGDGEVSGNETCDDGDGNSDGAADACRTTCVAPSCGDGARDTGEECDDGNDNDGDDCSNTCIDAGGCGCRSNQGGAGGFALLLLALLIVRTRNRRSA
jgi:cysteine-rich repeat protein